MHDEFRGDQQRHHEQELDLDLDVQQEWHGRTAAEQLSADGREQQQRQPGNERNDDDAPPLQRKRVVGQMRAPQQLEQRPAQDE